MSLPSLVALIPARGGSKRIPKKNLRDFCGHPLIWWTIQAAQESGICQDVRVCTEDEEIAAWCRTQADIILLRRSRASATDDAPDITWVRECLPEADAFAILRPTSPFRTGETIRRAWRVFLDHQPCDSLRAVQPVREHPGKMWTYDAQKYRLMPVMPYRHREGTPWHSSPTQTLRPVYVQNASLEIAWTKTVEHTGTISGDQIVPFFTEGIEGVDLNTPADWDEAERVAAEACTVLP